MKAQVPYFDIDGNLCHINADDDFGIALLKRFAYWRKDFGVQYSQCPQTALFTNEIAFINCLSKWNTQGQENGHHWVYHPAKNWAFPK